MRRAAALTLAALLLGAAPARAEEVTGAELRELTARAETDPAALERLRRVDRVDGRPADVGAALRGADGKEAAARLGQLEPAAGPPAPGGASPRDRAQELLRDRRYRGTDLPRPFAGALKWIGDRLRPVGDAVEDAYRAVVRVFPGGSLGVWILLALVVAALAALVGRQAVRRRAAAGGTRTGAATGAGAERPRDLERAADEAERAGRWEEAVRLRFRAGLLRLDERQVLEYRPSLTTGEVAETLRLESFDRVGARFDAVAYGGEPAGPEDAEAARREWAEVLAAGGR